MNFFDDEITERVNDLEFGLCDITNKNRDKHPNKPERSFVGRVEDKSDWIATVYNPHGLTLSFVPVDKGVIADDNPVWINRGRCDGIIHDDFRIIFVELKDERGGWISHALHQLRDSIDLFVKTHGKERLDGFRQRSAFACNKRHPRFNSSHIESIQLFRDKFNVRLHIIAEIKITTVK